MQLGQHGAGDLGGEVCGSFDSQRDLLRGAVREAFEERVAGCGDVVHEESEVVVAETFLQKVFEAGVCGCDGGGVEDEDLDRSLWELG